jgi:hypothetical protein
VPTIQSLSQIRRVIRVNSKSPYCFFVPTLYHTSTIGREGVLFSVYNATAHSVVILFKVLERENLNVHGSQDQSLSSVLSMSKSKKAGTDERNIE